MQDDMMRIRHFALSVGAGCVLAVSLMTGLVAQGPPSGVPASADAATIVHVLNRIGFGPAPGDLARVARMGVAACIDEQLHPERPDDSSLAARLASCEPVTLSTREIANKYYLPALMQRRGEGDRPLKGTGPLRGQAPFGVNACVT